MNLPESEKAALIDKLNSIVQEKGVAAGLDDLLRELDAASRKPRSGGRKAGPIVHGKPSSYSVRGCRCDVCKTAYKEWRLSRGT